MADTDKLQQVLDNLLSNAVKYSPQPGKIELEGKCLESCYQINIRDYGIGMNQETVERIFDKFYRADSGNTGIGGLGLGMNIAQQIILDHQGQISVASTPGEGTCVSVQLPLATG